MTVREGLRADEALTEETAQPGTAMLSLAGEDFVISEGQWWSEGDIVVIRSSEFDVMSEGDSFEEAMAAFFENVLEYGLYLAEIVERGDASSDEQRIHAKISSRFLQVTRAFEREQERRRRRSWFGRRRRGHETSYWRRPQTPAQNSTRLSHA